MATKKVLHHQSSEKHYSADVCRVECIDDRFRDALQAFESHANWHKFDRLQLAGGAKSLADGQAHLLEQIDISLRLHNTKEIVLTIHQACGAYGQSMPIEQEDALVFIEKELQAALRSVQELLKQKGKENSVPVRLLAVMFDGIYEIV